MTIGSSHDDAIAGFPPPMTMRTADDDAVYRQDDAPPGAAGAAGAQEPADGTPAVEPSRSVDMVLSTLRATPHELGRLIEGQSDAALAQPASDGEWGVVEILPHLRDWEEVYLGWIRRLLDEEVPALTVVDDSLWAIEHDYAGEPVPVALAGFARLRENVMELLESLEPAAWARQAVHPQLGRITLHQLADRMCDHDARHIDQARNALG